MLITENLLDDWVRGHAVEFQGIIPELVARLVAASSPHPKERRFPLGDSVGQPGPDGILDAVTGYDPFVPEGKSLWEIGTGLDAGAKATSDYNDRTTGVQGDVRRQSVFIFVTPLSGRRGWPADAQKAWLLDRRGRGEWRGVNIIDGTRLVDWLQAFPAVEQWLARRMGIPAQGIQAPEQRWSELRTIGDPPPLIPQVFLANREKACEKLAALFSGTTVQLQLDSLFPDQLADFLSAYIASMDESSRMEVAGRCLIISRADAWEAICALKKQHILIADFNLDPRLLQKARQSHHSVIYIGAPGGVPHPNRETLANPKSHQLRDALQKAGYSEERARTLAQRTNGNLNSLLKCLQNLSLMPEWAQNSDAADLAIAEMLGAWRDASDADKLIAEKLSKKAYGEWIVRMREVALRPGTPLIQHDGVWKMVMRYEGWSSLGRFFYDDHLDRFREVAVSILTEKDPRFDLPRDERYAASLYGKVLTHSDLLRDGLSETLALLGSHPRVLTSCSFGKAESIAMLTVRSIFAGADWVLWASLNRQLPLIAEAAPGEFMDSVEKALGTDPCPFSTVFAQEDTGIMGSNYTTGLLWALESLAWNAEQLARVTVILGELAAKDPGGNWANRPLNSLITIFLPWLPQTCAPLQKRKSAIETLIRELPQIAWKLLLNLLPGVHQVSSHSHRPSWRQTIPEDWSTTVTQREYWEQITSYTDLAIGMAKGDTSKLSEFVGHLDEIPPESRNQILAHLVSGTITSLPQDKRHEIWKELTDLVVRHRKFSDAEWAMKAEEVDKIAAVADQLVPEDPSIRHRRLFNTQDFDLIEEKGDYSSQAQLLEERRRNAIMEILGAGGLPAVIGFAKVVESPWQVGLTFGAVAERETDKDILPALLDGEDKSLTRFSGGFVWGRYRSLGWRWVDEVNTSSWAQTQKGQFLAYLPFVPGTWERASKMLGEDESAYWTKTNVNPFETKEDLGRAIDSLVKYKRPRPAIGCLYRMHHEKMPLDNKQVVRVLLAAVNSPEPAGSLDAFETTDLIKVLQADITTDSNDLFKVEWAYLPLLDRHRGASPKLLEQRLADDPKFFCHLIQLIYRSDKSDAPRREPTEREKDIATAAYRLLSNWRTPPGSRAGPFDGSALANWLRKVKTACAESGHLQVAMSRVGHVLIHAPSDPDGLWIHRSVAEVLNAKEADVIRDGFQNEFFNSRGAHWVDPTGKGERELAAKHRDKAEKVEMAGFHRLAATLKELAVTYEREGERIAAATTHDD